MGRGEGGGENKGEGTGGCEGGRGVVFSGNTTRVSRVWLGRVSGLSCRLLLGLGGETGERVEISCRSFTADEGCGEL